MQGAERERLMREWTGEPAATIGATMKCGAALAVLALLAVIGASASDTAALPGISGAARPATSTSTGGAAALHRRQVYEERRARHAVASSPRLVLDAQAGQMTGQVAP